MEEQPHRIPCKAIKEEMRIGDFEPGPYTTELLIFKAVREMVKKMYIKLIFLTSGTKDVCIFELHVMVIISVSLFVE